jgi:hypothetical protein
MMNRFLIYALAVTLTISSLRVLADDWETLAGKWSVKKTNDQGQPFTQTVEVKKGKFVFQILGADGGLFLYAEGDLKLEKLEPFKVVKFTNIKAGQSAADTQSTDAEYTSIYILGDDTWTVAANFDKERQQKPTIDVYKKVKEEPATLIIDKIEMTQTPQTATWFICFEATANGVKQKYFVPNKGYDKTPVTIPVALSLANVRKGQVCNFVCQLDDVEDDVCTDEIDNKSTGSFTVTESGSQSYKPEDTWRYTIHWHLKIGDAK